MVGLLAPLKGKIIIDRDELWLDGKKKRKDTLKKLGVLFQNGALWSSMTVFENVAMPLEIFTDLGEKEVENLVDYKLALVGLAGAGNFYPSELSGGMRKRAVWQELWRWIPRYFWTNPLLVWILLHPRDWMTSLMNLRKVWA